MKMLALDLGESRTGVALCEKDELIASPLMVINEYSQDKLIDRIVQLVGEHKPELIVVGHPVNMNGTCGARAIVCENIADAVTRRTGVKTVMWDERGTTVIAHGILNQTDTRGKKRKKVIDEVAAVLILESYMSFRKNNGGQG